MRRDVFIELAIRKIYGGFPNDDSDITNNLVNVLIEPAVAVAAKANYTDSIKLDGIAYVNNSFYITYKGLSISQDENFLWKITLPHLPHGLGHNNGLSTLQLKGDNQITLPLIPITQDQKTFFQNMRQIPNKILYYSEGQFLFIISTIILSSYTVNVTMVSGGDSTDLDSELNVPADYIPLMIDFIGKQLLEERVAPVDVTNEGMDFIKTT